MVDVLVVASAEVDALKAAGFAFAGLFHLRHGNGAVALDDECVAGFDFAYLIGGHIEGRLDDGAFACDHDYFVVFVPESRADAVGIAHDKCIPVADQTTHDVPTVEGVGAVFQYGLDVEFICDALGNGFVGQALLLVSVKQPLVFHVQEMTDALEDGHRVDLFFGVLAQADQLLE